MGRRPRRRPLRPISPRAALARLWRRRRALLVATAFAALAALFFAGRFLLHLALWEEAPRHEPFAPWMTLGYVARTYDLDRADLARALGLDPARRGRLTLRAIAAETGRPLSEVEAELRAAIEAAQDQAPGEAQDGAPDEADR